MEKKYADLVEAQKHFFESGETFSYQFRKEQLLKLKQGVRKFEREISEALYRDLRKAELESYATEIGFVYEELNYMLKHLKKWMKPEKVASPLVMQPSHSRIYREPRGLTLIIAPWNYPFQLLISPLVGAIAGGNCVILKPSEETAHTAAVVERMIRAVFPEKFVALVQGNGAEVVPALMDNFAFDHVFFTGSVPVGKIIMAAAAKHLTPVTLELGGKSPCIVDETANLAVAARKMVWGKFLNAGQTCVAPDYLLVQESVKEPLLQELKAALLKFYGPDPVVSPDYPRMVNRKRFDAVAKFLEKGRIILGGDSKPEELYIAPTLIDEVELEDPVMQEEIFGPVLPVLTFRSIQEVPGIVALKPYPLALYLFTTSKVNEDLIMRSIRFGGGCVNDTMVHLGNPSIPFGGVGTSGFGAYHGKYSFDTFTHAKGVLKSSSWLDIPMRYPPYAGKLKWLKKLMK
ncbi:aldehyde dehydrogenase [Pedobacter sp. SYSU D00535]|uniref:aldehyde dehydrogenase n=1 Tax=Pedobacter sp. SYSU D00535 TaxID=2810308 RepID=UPI001A966F24|nr:aldehyde dehydrogenase [Pedobacter sp. SYSU D00535]